MRSAPLTFWREAADGFLDPRTHLRHPGRIRDLIAHEVVPLEAALLTRPFAEIAPELGQVRQKVKDLGLWAPQIPRSHGGLGLTCLEYALVGEELGKSPLGHYVVNGQAPDAGNMEILREFGSESQQERWLAPLVRGDIRSCFAMTEPDHAGSNPVWMGTTAVRDGDDYVMNGRKWFASAADGAQFCNRDDGHRPRGRPLPSRQPDRRARPTHRGIAACEISPAWDTPATTGPATPSSSLIDCRVPRENLLGEEGAGFAMAQARLGPGRIQHTMRWIGVCRRALEMMCHRAATRQLAPADPLGSRQTVQNWIAESRARSTPRGSWSCTRPGRSTPKGSPPLARRSRSSNSTSRA